MKFCFIFRKLCSVQRNYIFPEVGERGCEIKWGGGLNFNEKFIIWAGSLLMEMGRKKI